MKRFIVFITLIATVFMANALKMNGGKDATIVESGIYDEDYMFGGRVLDFTGKTDDLYFGGEQLTFSGETVSGITALGNTINIGGKIGNDIVAAGKIVILNGVSNGTIFVAGDTVTIASEGIVNGTIFMAGGTVHIKGTVNGDIFAGAGRLIIDGVVNGNIKTAAGTITIGEKSTIAGQFWYTSKYKLSEKESARVAGELTYIESIGSKDDINGKKVFFVFMGILRVVMLISFIIGGFLLLLFPLMSKAKIGSVKSFWKIVLWGMIPFFIYPALMFAFILPGITMPLSGLLVLGGLPVFFVTQVVGVTLTGEMIFKAFGWKEINRFGYFSIGLLPFIVLGVIPVISVFSTILFSSAGWGIIISGLLDKNIEAPVEIKST